MNSNEPPHSAFLIPSLFQPPPHHISQPPLPIPLPPPFHPTSQTNLLYFIFTPAEHIHLLGTLFPLLLLLLSIFLLPSEPPPCHLSILLLSLLSPLVSLLTHFIVCSILPYTLLYPLSPASPARKHPG